MAGHRGACRCAPFGASWCSVKPHVKWPEVSKGVRAVYVISYRWAEVELWVDPPAPLEAAEVAVAEVARDLGVRLDNYDARGESDLAVPGHIWEFLAA